MPPQPRPGSVGGEDEDTPGSQTLDDLPLGPGHALRAAKALQVGAPGVGNGDDLRAGDMGQIGDLPRVVGAHLQHQEVLLPRLQQGQGQTDIIVEVAPGRPHSGRLGEDGGDHLFGSRLAIAPGEGHHPASKAIPVGGRQPPQGQAAILHLPLGQVDGQGALDHQGHGAGRPGGGGIIVAIVTLAVQGDEQTTTQRLPAVDADPAKANVRP